MVEQQPEATYGELFAFLRRGLPFALLAAFAAAGTAFVLSARLDPVFEAQARLLVAQPTPELRNFGGVLVAPAAVDVRVYRAAAMTDSVLVDALARVGVEGPTPQQVDLFRDRVDVRFDEAGVSSIIHIRVRHRDRVVAADEANALATALSVWDQRRAAASVRRVVEALEGQLSALDEQISTLRAQGASQTEIEERIALREAQRQQLSLARALQTSTIGLLEGFEVALSPIEPSQPRPARTAALTAAAALALAYALLLLRRAIDSRLRSVEEVQRRTMLPLLAEFQAPQEGTRRLAREATSFLRTNLHYALPAERPSVLVVTGTDRSSGTFPVSLSLAESYARNDQRTLLIDADLRKSMPRSALAKEYDALGLGQPSLREHLEHPERAVLPTEIDLGGGASLGFIASFHPAPYPSELLSRSFGPLLGRLRDRFDVIIVDTAPVLAVADTLIVAPHASGIVLVVDMESVERRVLQSAITTLEPVRARVLGTVAVNVVKEPGRSGAYAYREGLREEAGQRMTSAPRDPQRKGQSPLRRPARDVRVGRRA